MSDTEGTDLGELSYRDVQHKLKAMGLPAKGPDKVLRERLAEALGDVSTSPNDPSITLQPDTVKSPKSSRKAKSPKVEVKIKTVVKSPKLRPKEEDHEDDPQAEGRAEEIEREAKVEDDKSHPDPSPRRQSRRISDRRASLPDNDKLSPARKRRKSRVSLETKDPHTPLDQIKRFARNGAVRARKSLGKLEKEFKKRKFPWWLLPLLLAALLLGSQWRHTLYWHRHINDQIATLNSGIASLKDQGILQASRLGHNANEAYQRLYRSTSQGADRLWSGVNDVYGKALHIVPSHHKLPESACSARLNTTTLDTLFSVYPPHFGLSTTLSDVWRGHKENPLKATGVLLAGRDVEQVKWATGVIQSAVPPDCKHCLLLLQGDDYSQPDLSVAGKLQRVLAAHVRQCPYAIIQIQLVNHIHPDALPALINALSEQGSLTSEGKSISTSNALFIGSTIAPSEVFTQTGEEELASAVKRDLSFQIELRTDPTKLATPEAFRRRWDYVAPILQKIN